MTKKSYKKHKENGTIKEASERFGDLAFLDSLVITDR